MAEVWREGQREPDEGWRTEKQAMAIIQERGDRSLGKTVTTRIERRCPRHDLVKDGWGVAQMRGWVSGLWFG